MNVILMRAEMMKIPVRHVGTIRRLKKLQTSHDRRNDPFWWIKSAGIDYSKVAERMCLYGP